MSVDVFEVNTLYFDVRHSVGNNNSTILGLC